jgi:hypothetical protein
LPALEGELLSVLGSLEPTGANSFAVIHETCFCLTTTSSNYRDATLTSQTTVIIVVSASDNAQHDLFILIACGFDAGWFVQVNWLTTSNQCEFSQ